MYNDKGEVPEDDYVVPLGKADIKREGCDLSLIAHGPSVLVCLEAAGILSSEHGIQAEVVDLRSIRPLDEEKIVNSIKKTNRAVLVEENKPFCGVGAQVSHMIQSQAFDYLDAPIQRVSALDAPAIYSPPQEKKQLPKTDVVVEKALEIC